MPTPVADSCGEFTAWGKCICDGSTTVRAFDLRHGKRGAGNNLPTWWTPTSLRKGVPWTCQDFVPKRRSIRPVTATNPFGHRSTVAAPRESVRSFSIPGSIVFSAGAEVVCSATRGARCASATTRARSLACRAKCSSRWRCHREGLWRGRRRFEHPDTVGSQYKKEGENGARSLPSPFLRIARIRSSRSKARSW